MFSRNWLQGLQSAFSPNRRRSGSRPHHNRRSLRLENLEDRRVLSAVPGWAFNVGDTGRDGTWDVAVDAAGDVYTAGYFEGTTDFDFHGSAPGSDNILTADETDIFVAAYTPSGEIKWARNFGETGDDYGYSIATVGGFVYVAGANRVDTPQGRIREAFVAKLDAATGEDISLNWNPQYTPHEWAVGGAGIKSMAIDGNGGLYLTGDFNTDTDFGDGNFATPDGYEQFVVKLDEDGDFQWATTTGAGTHFHRTFVSVDQAGSVYLTGSHSSIRDVGVFGNSVGDYAHYVAKLNADGDFQWAKGFNSLAYGLTTDATGNTYITGGQNDNLIYDGEAQFPSGGSTDGYVMKVNSAGLLQWASEFQSNVDATGYDVTLDGDGFVHVAGSFNGNLDLAAGFNFTSDGNRDGFTAKLDPTSGAVLAAEHIGGAGDGGAWGVAVDDEGNIYTAGGFGGTAEFPSGDVLEGGLWDSYLWKQGQSLISVTPTSPLITSEDGDTATFEVVLTEQPTDDVIIDLVSLNPNEGTIMGADPVTGKLTLTFTAANYDSPQTVMVVGVDDSETDGEQVYQIDLLAATSDDPNFDGSDAGKVRIVNVDNDTVNATFSNNTPVQLNDAKGKSPGVTTSTIDVAAAGAILDLNVQLNISHTYDEDLSAFLIAPDGTRVELFSGVGGSGDNFSGTVFDDEAVAPINGSAPFAGIYQPAGLLEAFDSLDPSDPSDPSTENLSGTWTLEIVDSNKFDTGTLNSWSITVLYAPVEVPNSPPVAEDDVASTSIDTPVVIEFNDLLANDSDPDTGDTLSVTSVGSASNGTVIDNGDGTVTYTPNAGFVGTDSFTYTIDDGNGGSDTATVNVSVTDPSAGQTYTSTDTPLNIQDPHRKHPRSTTSVISITSSDAIASLVIDLDIDHADEGNLSVTLESSSAGPVDLVYDAGSDTWSLSDPSAFLGTNLGGIWILTVSDTNRDGITGTLNDWSLTATTGVSATAALDEAFAEFAVD